MSVERTDYIVYGYKLPYELKNDNGKIDLYKDEIFSLLNGKDNNGFIFITDGMCGEYNVFGILVSEENSEDEGWEFVHLDFKNLDAEKVKIKYREIFELEKDTPIPNPYLFIFSHYS